MQTETKEVLDALKELGSATVYNAVVYNMGGTPDGLTRKVEGGQPENYTGPEIHCMLPELGPVAGYAVTAEITSNDPDTPGVPWDDYHEALARETAPIIAVIKDADSRPGRGAAFGDDMAGRYKAFGTVGVIVDGSVRDLEGIEEVGMPTWGGGRVPGHGVFTLVRVNAPVTVAQLRIEYGDLLVADSDGCTKIPEDQDPADILRHALEVQARERKSRELYRQPGFNMARWRELRASREIPPG